MKGKHTRYLIVLMLVALMGIAVFAAACGEADDTTATTAAATETTAGATETTAATEPAGGASGNVAVEGLVDNPITLTVAALEEMNVITASVEKKDVLEEYRGVLLSEVFASVGVQASATTVTMVASDGYMVELPLADIQANAEAMLAIGDDGALTVVLPGMSTKNWVKDVVSIEFK